MKLIVNEVNFFNRLYLFKVDEMQNSEEQWKTLALAARNKELIKRWKHQIKVSLKEIL